jgi:hypothetical protein
MFGLQELKAEKICLPQNGFELVFILSVDGTDCPVEEPRPSDKGWFSQKTKGPGVKYEVAFDVLIGCVWISGPYKASKSEITIYRQGLRQLIPPGKLVVADKALRGETNTVSFPYHLDYTAVAALCQKPILVKHKACFKAIVFFTMRLSIGFSCFTYSWF